MPTAIQYKEFKLAVSPTVWEADSVYYILGDGSFQLFVTDHDANPIPLPPVDLSDYLTETQINTLLGDKVDKVTGKALSTNDYTTVEKNKLAAISGTNTGDQTTITGNAGTATALQTARNIDGISFNGTANITVIAPATHASVSKTTPVDIDEIPLADSAAAYILKKLTWANIKATLKTYFDTVYIDDVLEYADLASFPGTGVTGIIYIAADANTPYRWSGSSYVALSAPIASTDDLTEGTTNLYYTTARVHADAPAEDWASIGTIIDTAQLKDAPDDTDEFGYWDNIDNTLKKMSWTDLLDALEAPFSTEFESQVNKDASDGYAGLTLFKINFKNSANTFTSFFTNSNSASRTYTFQNRSGTIADDTDITAAKARANHTGTQLAATISDFNAAALSAAPAETVTTIGTLINGATSKTTPVDADHVALMDSAASNVVKKLSWANIKATLKTYFDTLYQSILVSGTNIKTVNGTSLLGSGDVTITGGISESLAIAYAIAL